MGHVPTGPVPAAGPGPHLPRRQRGAIGEAGDLHLSTARRRIGEAGERIAAWYLQDRGLQIIARNHLAYEGEIDLLALDGAERVAFEVRTRIGGADPADAADPAKRRQVASLARRSGATRVDVIGLRIDSGGLDIHWVPRCG